MDQCLTLLGTALAVVSHTERPSLGSTRKETKETKHLFTVHRSGPELEP